MANKKDLTGKKYGKLIAIRSIGKNKWGIYKWLCQCDCGKITVLDINSFGKVKSCGCLLNSRNRMSVLHKEYYNIYSAMIQRCYNLNNRSYKRYGARGIKVCDRWLNSFENFFVDMGEKPSSEHSIDRIDNNGDYTPQNCRWATRKEQAQNTRRSRKLTFDGKTKTMSEWARQLKISRQCLQQRMKQGYSIKDAIDFKKKILR